MASPPSSGLALPRQRPGLPPINTSRKSSLAPGSAHPLRQTSFPPSDTHEAQNRRAGDTTLDDFSPDGGDNDSLDDVSDSEIKSMVSGPISGETTGKKRKRGEKRARGRPRLSQSTRQGSASIVNGDDGKSQKRGGTAGAPSITTGDGHDQNEEAEDDASEDEAAAEASNQNYGITESDLKTAKANWNLFRDTVKPSHKDRLDEYGKVKLRVADVRKLVNATLSQSVPPNVMTVVGAYTKLFAGMLIEGAREVQMEWMASQPTRPDEGENRAYKRLRMMQPLNDEDEDEEGDKQEKDEPKDGQDNANIKKEGTSPSQQEVSLNIEASQTNGAPEDKTSEEANGKKDDPEDELDDFHLAQPGAWGLSKYLDQCDRGPLLPDHLREALRRYKKSRAGGSVGFTGMSLERPEVAAPRLGGKRLFR